MRRVPKVIDDSPDFATEARNRFLSKLPNWNRTAPIPVLLGSSGYDLPDLDDLVSSRQAAPPGGQFCIEGGRQENHVLVAPDFKPAARFRIVFAPGATGNVVVLPHGADVFGEFKIQGTDNIAIFSASGRGPCAINLAMQGNASTFFWGRESSSNGLSVWVTGNRSSVIIGEDCMVAQRVSVMTSDMHAVVDVETGAWLNGGAPVLIEPHVWLGWESMVMKGTSIGFGASVAARSVITRDVPRLAVSGGTPNQTIRKNAIWTRPSVPVRSAIAEVFGLAEKIGVTMGRMPLPHPTWSER